MANPISAQRTQARCSRVVSPLLLVTLVACGAEDPAGPTGGTNAPVVTSVRVSPGGDTLASLGDTISLVATAYDGAGSAIAGKTFTWSTSDHRIATVSESGVVTAMDNGSATITATVAETSGTSSILVAQVPARLAFSSRPPPTLVGAFIAPAVKVVVQDARFGTVRHATQAITIALGANRPAGTLLGTTTRNAIAGEASFPDLSIHTAGDGYTLVATSGSLGVASSEMFDIWATAAGIENVSLTTTTVAIGGGSVGYTATVTNIGTSTLYPVVLQAYIDQGSRSRAAGGLSVNCGTIAQLGRLPPGTCRFNFTLSAANDGTLVPGGAVARFVLSHGNSPLDTLRIDVTLVEFIPPPLPRVTLDAVTLASSVLTIGVATTYVATITNAESHTVSGLFVQGYIEQGSTSRGAGGASLSGCGGALTQASPGTCLFTRSLTASNAAGGTGFLVAGPARARIELYQYDAGLTRVLGEVIQPVTLVY